MVCPVCVAAAITANAPAIAAAFGGVAAMKLAFQRGRETAVCQRKLDATASEDVQGARNRVAAAPVRTAVRKAPFKPVLFYGSWEDDS